MRLVRFLYLGQVYYGCLESNEIVFLKGDVSTGFSRTGKKVTEDDVKLLCPAVPSKAICIGLNYMDHIIESHEKTPTEPVVFMKPSTAVIGPLDKIIYPSLSKRVDYEGELAIVIGKRASHVTEEDAADYILGYTCANDVTARDLQLPGGQWTIAKGFDTFLPMGPCINTDIDPNNLAICTVLNGKTVQSSNTSCLLFKPNYIVSFISSIMTLAPGDVILTGTTLGIGPMQTGDTVCVEIEGIGRLVNSVE